MSNAKEFRDSVKELLPKYPIVIEDLDAINFKTIEDVKILWHKYLTYRWTKTNFEVALEKLKI